MTVFSPNLLVLTEDLKACLHALQLSKFFFSWQFHRLHQSGTFWRPFNQGIDKGVVRTNLFSLLSLRVVTTAWKFRDIFCASFVQKILLTTFVWKVSTALFRTFTKLWSCLVAGVNCCKVFRTEFLKFKSIRIIAVLFLPWVDTSLSLERYWLDCLHAFSRLLKFLMHWFPIN